MGGLGHAPGAVQQQLAAAGAGKPLSVVNDQFGCPTYAGDLAAIVLQLLQRYQQQGSVAYGLYHLAGQPAVSWYQFAQAIFAMQQMPVSILPVSSANYAAAAQRLSAGNGLSASVGELEDRLERGLPAPRR